MAIGWVCAPPIATTRASRNTTWCGSGSSPRMMNAPLTVAGNRSNLARTEMSSLTPPPDYVPCSHERRYPCCSAVSWSISIRMARSFSVATSTSISAGTG